MAKLCAVVLWRGVKIWVAVRLVVTALMAGGQALRSAVGEAAGSPDHALTALLRLDGSLVFVTVCLVVGIAWVHDRRSGIHILLANFGLGIRHVIVLTACAAAGLEALVHIALLML